MSKEDLAYQEWVRELEGKLPAEVQDAFKAITSHDAGKDIFRGGLRRQDYDRRVTEIQREREKLQNWFEEEAPKNQRLVAEAQDYQKKLVEYQQTLRELGIENTNPGATASSVVRKEDLEGIRQEFAEKVRLLDQALPQFLGDVSTVIHTAVKENYNINPREVIDYAAEKRVTPIQAFKDLTADERGRREVVAQKALETKWKEEGAREALSKLPSPTYIRPSGPTVVENLSNKDFASDARSRVAGAVKDFLEGDFKGSGTGLF